MDESSQLEQLLALSLLSGMPEDTRVRVARLFLGAGQVEHLADGDTLLRQDALGGDTGYVILTGQVQVEKEGGSLQVTAPALLGEMYHLNPHAHRTADVTAQGDVEALRFSWRALYQQAKQDLAPNEQMLLMSGIERTVLERFQREMLMDLPLFRGLPDHLRLRASLALLWLAHPVHLSDGELLFEQTGMCGDTGYLLTHGAIELSRAGQGTANVAPPNVIGVMPDFDPNLRWTATARAKGNTEVQRFAWLEFMRTLQQRLSTNEQQELDACIRKQMGAHFAH